VPGAARTGRGGGAHSLRRASSLPWHAWPRHRRLLSSSRRWPGAHASSWDPAARGHPHTKTEPHVSRAQTLCRDNSAPHPTRRASWTSGRRSNWTCARDSHRPSALTADGTPAAEEALAQNPRPEATDRETARATQPQRERTKASKDPSPCRPLAYPCKKDSKQQRKRDRHQHAHPELQHGNQQHKQALVVPALPHVTARSRLHNGSITLRRLPLHRCLASRGGRVPSPCQGAVQRTARPRQHTPAPQPLQSRYNDRFERSVAALQPLYSRYNGRFEPPQASVQRVVPATVRKTH
jgi:hypothetical protein